MKFDEVKSILNALDNRRNELDKVVRIQNSTKPLDDFITIEGLHIDFSKPEVAKILDEKKQSLENNIRELAKQLSELE